MGALSGLVASEIGLVDTCRVLTWEETPDDIETRICVWAMWILPAA